MYGQDFTFNGKSLSEFGMMMCVFDGVDDDKLSLNRDIISTEFNSHRDYINILSAKYTETLSFQISIIKNICENKTQDKMVISRSELRALTSWLTSASTTSTFILIDDDEKFDEYVEYDCLCTNIEPFVVSGNIYGVTATFTCNAPYGYSKTRIEEYSSSSNRINFVYYNDSDVYDKYYYPDKVKIYANDNTSEIVIKNNTLGITSKIDITNIGDIIIDAKRKIIYANDDYTYPFFLEQIGVTCKNLISNINSYGSDFYWFGMKNSENAITIEGDIEKVEIHSRFPRKVGAF